MVLISTCVYHSREYHLFWILVLSTSTPDSMLQKIAVNDDWCLEFVFPFDGN